MLTVNKFLSVVYLSHHKLYCPTVWLLKLTPVMPLTVVPNTKLVYVTASHSDHGKRIRTKVNSAISKSLMADVDLLVAIDCHCHLVMYTR